MKRHHHHQQHHHNPLPHSVWYAHEYNPKAVGNIDGNDEDHTMFHDKALVRAQESAYDVSRDLNIQGDPYCTLFVARLHADTSEATLHSVFGRFGDIRRLRLVRHIVTQESRGYAFIEYVRERDFEAAFYAANRYPKIDDRGAIERIGCCNVLRFIVYINLSMYNDAHRMMIDGRMILVDYERERVMKGWKPRRLGGGLGGKKESGQLRFGGRDKPFRMYRPTRNKS
jgi:U11/U12 small nuclear ribonucleoprotein SNRNP35